MQTYQLSAKPRTLTGRKNYALRVEGSFPAVVYGEGVKEPKNVAVERREFIKVFKAAGESGIIELGIDGKTVNVLVQDIQTDPLRDEVIHADFRAIDMNKPIEVDVKIAFVGESPAIKGLGGIFVRPFEALRVRALPKDLPHEITVDISGLKTFEDICAGRANGGPVAALPAPERFHWLVSPRSTMIQTSPVHVGRSEEPSLALEDVLARLVRAPSADQAVEASEKGR